ncbi:MAG: hypothetical protein AAGB97_04740 [Dehalococcoidia bacterium]
MDQEYESIKERATKLIGAYLDEDPLISFDHVKKEVKFTSERLIPLIPSGRPRVMLLFSNPHPYSIKQGMFLSPSRKNRENLFWPIMGNAGWFSIPEGKRNPECLRNMFLRVTYSGAFELCFYCYYAFPTRSPDDIRRIFKKRVLSQIIEPDARDEFRSELNKMDVKAVVTFNKDIFNLVSEDKIERCLDRLNRGELVQSHISDLEKQIPLFLTYPTGWRYHKEYRRLRKASLERIKAAILQAV